MKTILTVVLTLMIISPLAMAGKGSSCHFHGSKKAEKSTIEQCGIERKNLYLKNGTLDTSWSNIEPSVIEIVDGAKGKEWRLRFDNPNAPDSSKRSLYMFFSLPGNFIAANYSGK